MSNPKSKDSVIDEFLDHCRFLCKYWSRQDKSKEEAVSGAVFSVLTLIDGCSALPAIDLVLRPHQEDKDFAVSEGEDWYVDGQVINDDVMLHDFFYKKNSC